MTEDNRFPEIRAVLDEAARDHTYPGGLPITDLPAPGTYFERIRAILDSAPPAPRVFFPGDTVPAGPSLLREDDVVVGSVIDNYVTRHTLVEILPSPDAWQAAVDRASEERAIPEPTEGQNP